MSWTRLRAVDVFMWFLYERRSVHGPEGGAVAGMGRGEIAVEQTSAIRIGLKNGGKMGTCLDPSSMAGARV
jgi:hypothetical protein